MASNFDRWEKDPFFPAAEEVQDSAGWNRLLVRRRAVSANADFGVWKVVVADDEPLAAPPSKIFADSVKLKSNEFPKVQLETIHGQAKAQTLPPKKAMVKPPKQAKQSQPPQPKLKPNERKSEVRNVFGGLFKQETIYIDDD